MSKFGAAALVFVCSAAVLMLEILAGRMLAPYVGISLETYTSIIGTVLAGIAAGAWIGGRLADRFDARRLLGPAVALGGVLALLTVPIVRALGDQSGEGGRSATLLLTFAGFFPSAVVLSAVTPMVVKLQLKDLGSTGGVVGFLSGMSTFGALVGTFATGYLLTETAPTRVLIYALGGTLVVIGIAVGLALSRRGGPVLVGLAVLAAGAVTLGASTREPCQVESAYFCIRVERDPVRPSGRTLWMDNLTHSYVDLEDPTFLSYHYENDFSDVIAARWPDHPAIDALHLGGGGFTLPRYLEAQYPGTKSIVLEIDPAVLKVGRERLGLRTSDALEVRTGDARIGIRSRPDDSADLVVGDAFASLSVPWHLTTKEFAAEIDRVLRPDGMYVMNIVDYPPFRFVRSQLATLRSRFEWVAAISPTLEGYRGGNVVLVAAHRRPFEGEYQTQVYGHELFEGARLDWFIANSPTIRDDFAPVDQWLDADKNG